MAKWRILAVDDEPLNLEILSEYFNDPKYSVQTAEHGALAWQMMDTATEAPHVVILDRMMPIMDGMELLKKIKADPRFKDIPVIMQTAASAPEQVREGIEAGAWYYLTKPYGADSLLAIVSAALYQVAKHAKVETAIRNTGRTLSLINKAEFVFNELDDVAILAAALSDMCDEPSQVAMGLTELLVNAVEHGNLGISYDEKKHFRLNGGWDEEINRRRALPECQARKVVVSLERTGDGFVYTITDEGSGFNWQRYLDFDPERAFDPNGRGIAMARNACFSDIQYQGRGNIVIARVTNTRQKNDDGAATATRH